MPLTMRCRLAGVLGVMGLLCAPASAAVWYASVGKGASDSNPGTATRPVATVQKAVCLAKPGDTVVFQPGTYARDPQSRPGDPRFVDAQGHTQGYRLQADSAARDQGMLLYERPVDCWNAPRPHLSKTEKYDLGAHEFGAAGLDRATFPYEVPPYKLQFKAKPPR